MIKAQITMNHEIVKKGTRESSILKKCFTVRAVAPQSIRLQKTDAKDQITNIDCPESEFL